jgi:hypothetical protein
VKGEMDSIHVRKELSRTSAVVRGMNSVSTNDNPVTKIIVNKNVILVLGTQLEDANSNFETSE